MLDMISAFILRQARCRLRALSDHQLVDIGITRSDAADWGRMLDCMTADRLASRGLYGRASAPAWAGCADLCKAAMLCSPFLAAIVIDVWLAGLSRPDILMWS